MMPRGHPESSAIAPGLGKPYLRGTPQLIPSLGQRKPYPWWTTLLEYVK
jgi:hypothetical protein